MKAIFVGTNREPFVIEFKNKLENLQALVDGYIQILNIKASNKRVITLIFNEEGKYFFSKANKLIVYEGTDEKDFITGNIIVVATDEEKQEFVSLTDEEIEFYLKEMSKKEILIPLAE